MSVRVQKTEYANTEATNAPASSTKAKTNDKLLQTAFDEEVTVINNDSNKKSANIGANDAMVSDNTKNIKQQTGILAAIGNEISDLVNSNSVISGLIETAQSAIGVIEKKIDGITSKIADILDKEGDDADVSALEKQVQTLQDDKAKEEKAIEKQEDELEDNKAEIKDLTDEQKDTEEEIKALEQDNADLEGKNDGLQEGIEGNEEKIDELEEELEAAQAKEAEAKDAEEALEAETAGNEAEASEALEAEAQDENTTDLTGLEGQTGETDITGLATDTDIAGATDLTGTGVVADANVIPDTSEEVPNGDELVAADEDTTDSASELVQIAIEQGTTVEIVEAAKTYEDMGLAIDVQTIANASVIELDEIVETAIVQDVIKTSSRKMKGNVGAITSKKQMKENAEAVEAFQSNFITLENYYNTNGVYNAEAKGFITIAKVMYSDLAQGATYATSDIQQANDTALKLTASLQTEVATSVATKDADTQFEDTKTEAKNAIEKAKAEVGEEENDGLTLCETEFITLTSNYRNATTDTEKQKMISDLLELITDARSIEQNPDDKIINDERLVVTL